MPTLTIEGRSVAVDDGFLKLSPAEQNKTVDEIAASLRVKPAAAPGIDPSDPRFTPAAMAGEKFLEGAPVLGAFVPEAGAAINALAQPLTGVGAEGEDIPTRYRKNLLQHRAASKAVDEQTPGLATTAKVMGGVASLGGAITAIPKAAAVLGAEGTIPQMITRGAASGAALSAADAAARGEDPQTAALEGGGLGAVAGPAGRVIGKGVQAVRGAFRPAPAPIPAVTAPVAGVDIRVPTTDPAVASKIEIARKGGAGDRAQQVVQQGDAADEAAFARANENIGSGLHPEGLPAPAPADAAEAVAAELRAAEQTRFQTEQNAKQRVIEGTEAIRRDLGQVDPLLPPEIRADSPGAAAEQIGAAVAQRRNAAVAGTKAKYGAVEAHPGTFDESVPRGMAEDIRTRLNSGDDPLWVDPQTTSKANEALRLIDQTIGGNSGLLENAAARGVAGAGAGIPAGTSDAAAAAAKLAEFGVSPEKARGMVARVPGADSLPPVGGGAVLPKAGGLAPVDGGAVSVPGGGQVAVRPKVVEASSVKTSSDAGYDPSLQPRDRSRAASELQINDMAANLRPSRLGASSEADRGAPIVGPDGLVESGNARVAAIRQAFKEGGESAAKYRDWLTGQGHDVSGFREPILVRERTTPMTPAERRAFTVAANQSSTLSMSATERALADSRLVTPESLAGIRNPADLGAAENSDFVRAFVGKLPPTERGAMLTAKGELSSEGLTRVRNAVLGKAYGDTPLLGRIAESTNDEVRSISHALVSAAPEWAALRAEVAAGRVPAALDATGDLLDAVSRTARIRGKGVGLAESRAQGDAFTKQTPESELFQRMFYDADGAKAASSSQVANAVRHYAQEAVKADAAPGLDLGLKAISPRDILELTASKVGAPKELAASVKEAAAAASKAAEIPSTVTLKDMDQARKRLVTMLGDAKAAAMRTGDRSDLRAMGKVLHEFDNSLLDAFQTGRFSGDGVEAQRLLKEARASHAAYRQTFTSRGAGDEVGRSVEKILGRYTDTAATPDQIAKLSYGTLGDPGGAQATKVAQRLRSILGPTSPEWGAFKQGLLSHLVDTPPGTTPRTAVQTADRIKRFLEGTQGKPYAQAVLSADERAKLASHMVNLRASEPVPLSALKGVDKQIARITGRDGGVSASNAEVADYLFGSTAAGKKSEPFQLAVRLKRDLSPEAFVNIQQGMWSKLTGVTEGKTAMTRKRMADNLDEFFNGKGKDMARVLYPADVRAEALKLSAALRSHEPIPGTTNPSGSAWMGAKIAGRAGHMIMPALGFAHGGIPGAIAGAGADRVISAVLDRRHARQAERLFYGKQPRASLPVDPRFAKATAAISRGAAQGPAGN